MVKQSKNKNTVHSIGGLSLVDTQAGTFALRMSAYSGSYSDSMERFLSGGSTSWDSDPVSVAGVRVVPWGENDNMPVMVRDLLERNNLGPGVLLRKAGLIYGQGPMLYRTAIDESGEVTRKWCEDAQIQSWLDTWDYRRFARNAIIEYNHMGGVFVKYVSGKGVRVGKQWIASLEALHSEDCRLVWPESGYKDVDSCRQVLTGDLESYRWRNIRLFPMRHVNESRSSEVSVGYHSLRSYGRRFYAVSSFLGSLPWMENANELPQIIKALNRNMMAGAYIVHEPAGYWDDKRMKILEMDPTLSMAEVNAKLEKLRDDVTRTIADVMAGSKNAGKFFTAVDFVDPATGKEQAWKIEPIEMNIDKYIDAQVKISRIADSSTTSGLGLNPALANIIIDGKGDSGSQMLYALKIFYGADTTIAEDIVLEAVNDAMAVNFPRKRDIRMGFYRQVVNKEDNVTASQRATNNM